jgi:AcrR family transcriptional regulator
MSEVMAEHLSDRAPSRRRANSSATREALLQAGTAEFAAKGLEAPSLDAICARAGYTRGAFYVHFEDREDFVAAVMDRVLSGFLDAILEAGSARHDLAETVAGFAGALPGAVGAIQLHRLIEACARSPRTRERWVVLVRETTLRVAKAVGEAQAGGGVRADVEAEQIGALLVGLALGVVAALESGAPFDPARTRDAVLALLSAPPASGARSEPEASEVHQAARSRRGV